MTPEKIKENVDRYIAELSKYGISARKINSKYTFGSQPKENILAHAMYLCKNIQDFIFDSKQWDKVNRHYAAIQMCLSFAHWYTLDQLREHNK